MLSVRDLEKRYGATVALAGTSFDVPDGRIVGFLGPNGAGKTTAMRCIFGLVHPESGDVTWDGRPVGRAERLRFGYMPEERGLYPKMRAGEQLAYLGRLSGLTPGDAMAAAAAWLGRLGLEAQIGTRVEELSHGNQQRVQLAAALVHNPDLAVLDEPFAGLDPLGVELLGQELREYVTDGRSVLFSSHQLDLVEDVCDDVVIIDQGRVVVAGDVHALRTRSPVRRLEVEVDGRPWEGAAGELTTITRAGRTLYEVPAGGSIDAVLEKARADGEVTRLVFEPPRLSDLFREAVAP